MGIRRAKGWRSRRSMTDRRASMTGEGKVNTGCVAGLEQRGGRYNSHGKVSSVSSTWRGRRQQGAPSRY